KEGLRRRLRILPTRELCTRPGAIQHLAEELPRRQKLIYQTPAILHIDPCRRSEAVATLGSRYNAQRLLSIANLSRVDLDLTRRQHRCGQAACAQGKLNRLY